MDVYTWVIFLYVAGTVMVGWFLLHEAGPVGHTRKDKHVGPTYWGIYTGGHRECDKTIALQEFHDDDIEGICGGSGFVNGRPVKSGRV